MPNNNLRIRKSNVTLVSYGNFKVKPLGEIFIYCKFKDISSKVKFIVVDFSAEPLLGLDYCLKFELIRKGDSVNLNTFLPNNKKEIFFNVH